MFHYTANSPKNLEATIKSVVENLKEEAFSVQWEFNINEKLAAKGLELDGQYRVLEVCNPKEAQRVLSANPLVSYFLPCKIVVYKEKDGQVKVGMPKPTALINLVEDKGLKNMADDIEKRLIASIEKSV